METQQNENINKPKLNIGFFFLSLGTLIVLITSVISSLNLVFDILDKKFPDILNSSFRYGYTTNDFESMRASMATLIIFFPIFILLSFFWNKAIKRGLGTIDEILKKWLIYIIIFFSSLTALIDFVVLIRYFISGEITNRFIFKVIAVFVVIGLVSIHYIYLIKDKENIRLKVLILIAGCLFVFGSIFSSFTMIGSPKTQRLIRLDDQRISDLANLQNQIVNYWQQKEKLPENLKELENPITGYSLPVPSGYDNGEKYEYIIKDPGKLNFEICATFDLSMQNGWITEKNQYFEPYGAYKIDNTDTSWRHGVGRTCFDRTIDKDIYPPLSKTK